MAVRTLGPCRGGFPNPPSKRTAPLPGRLQERLQPLRVFGVLVRLDMTLAFQSPDARLGIGRSQDLGLLVWDYGVFCGVDDEEGHTLIRECRGIPFRYHIPGVEVGEEPPCEQDRRLEQPSEGHELGYLAR